MTLTSKILVGLVIGFALVQQITAAAAATISGAGSTFVFPLLSKWAAAYKTAEGISVNYQPVGSAGGIREIESKTVTFGASDMPLSTAELNKYGLLQFPIINGAIVPVVNIRGVAAGQLILDGATLADIFLGKITKWNDERVKKLNPGLTLPDQTVVVVHRSDGSGTTFIWADYLAKASSEWKSKVGVATAVDWATGFGARGNEGVASSVGQAAGAIGYVEFAYAKNSRLKHARVINSAGKPTEPNFASFQAAANSANWSAAENFNLVLTNAPGDVTWPIAGSTWIIMSKKPANGSDSTEALKFFKWAYANGKDVAVNLDYVPMPDNVIQLIQASWKQIEGVSP